MTAFCDAIMAEVHRLEAQNADNAKMDFISSISHELRSPLHGILGSVECLQEQTWDAASDGLISQVEVCARTLLDIVNHVLDFSKINRYAKAQNRGMVRNRPEHPLAISTCMDLLDLLEHAGAKRSSSAFQILINSYCFVWN